MNDIKEILKTIIMTFIVLAYIFLVIPASFVLIGLTFDSSSSASNPLTYIIDGLILFVPFCIFIGIYKLISQL